MAPFNEPKDRASSLVLNEAYKLRTQGVDVPDGLILAAERIIHKRIDAGQRAPVRTIVSILTSRSKQHP